jgi:LDH2 family malate/lactate/ureidoglycolate dehydrogenase
MKISIMELDQLIQRALARFGYNEIEITTIKKVILYSQLRGGNQGVVKLIGAGIPKDAAAGEITTLRETKISALLDGSRSFGMLVMDRAARLAIQKAGEHGIGIVGTRNTYSSTGAIGFYAHEIANQGLAAFIFSGSSPAVAPYGSFEPIFGTNPLAIGIPTGRGPLVLDMATSAMARFGLIEAKTADAQISEGVAYDRQGNETREPGEALQGALKTFGGHKGAGLSFMIEVLTGPLVGASFAGLGRGDWGNLLLAFDPALFVDREDFEEEMGRLITRVKSAKRLPGVSVITLPGERGEALTRQNRLAGEVELEDNLYRELVQAAGG